MYMEIDSKNETKKSLKWFLIGRFLITMLFVYISVQLLGILYTGLILPTMTAILADQQVSVTAKGSPVLLMLQMLLYVMTSFLPDGLGGYAQRAIGQHVGGSFQIAVDSPLFSGLRGVVLRLLIIVMFLALIFISILPYLMGAFYYYRTVSKKVSELMEEEKEQQITYERNRNLLLSDIAHDIKTPITTLCSCSKALSDGLVQGDKRREYLDTIYHKSMRMNELITLLFEYVKMDSSGFELHREDCDLGEVLRECIAALYADFEEHKIALRVDIPETSTPYAADKVQMMRAVTNLLSNTIRYGKDGGKTFVQLKEYTITVADDGEQIDDELAGHIFEPFSRGDKARSTKGGSGLGLSIASKIVQMHGGELKLNRDYGHGYTKAFQIMLETDN